jgi:hypothetical protein
MSREGGKVGLLSRLSCLIVSDVGGEILNPNGTPYECGLFGW